MSASSKRPRPVASIKTAPTPPEKVEAELARHILPSSGTMIGICTTLVGLVKLLEGRTGPSHVDEYGAMIGVAFLGSAIFSYLAIRLSHRTPHISRGLERSADALFLLGLLTLVLLVGLFAFETV